MFPAENQFVAISGNRKDTTDFIGLASVLFGLGYDLEGEPQETQKVVRSLTLIQSNGDWKNGLRYGASRATDVPYYQAIENSISIELIKGFPSDIEWQYLAREMEEINYCLTLDLRGLDAMYYVHQVCRHLLEHNNVRVLFVLDEYQILDRNLAWEFDHYITIKRSERNSLLMQEITPYRDFKLDTLLTNKTFKPLQKVLRI